MTLIIILCALFIVKFTKFFHSVRSDACLVRYTEFFTKKMGNNAYIAILIALFLSAVFIILVQSLLISFAFGFLGWLLSLFILVYCLEETRFGEQSVELFYQEVLQRLFSVIFWFVLLGPAGCFAYRFLQRLSISLPDPMARRFSLWLVCILDWIPARLLALTFSFSSWRQALDPRLSHTYALLYYCSSTDEAQALVNRALFIWLFVLALLFIF